MFVLGGEYLYKVFEWVFNHCNLTGWYSLYCNTAAIPLETNNYDFVYDSLEYL